MNNYSKKYLKDFMSDKSILSKRGLPKCKNIGKKGGLPPLMGDGGITDYPRSGMDLEIDFVNSDFALFPIEIALEIARVYPKAWCKGGNYFGNYAFDHWFNAMKAIKANKKIPNESLRWMKKREQYIARHRQDFRLAGTIAMIKWAGFVDGYHGKGNGSVDGSSMNYMMNLIQDYGK
jgi:hypothetical protein